MASTLPVFNDVQNFSRTLVYLTSGTGGGTGDVTGWYYVTDEAELRAMLTTADHKVAVLANFGGFGGAQFRWDADSVAVDDGATVLEPDDGGPGRWIRMV
jgi:hypothetical protein